METKRTTDHDTIRDWVERRAGVPARVRDAEPDELEIDFPPGAGADSVEHISWEEWFAKFDEQDLCFLYQEEMATGDESNFFKLVPT